MRWAYGDLVNLRDGLLSICYFLRCFHAETAILSSVTTKRITPRINNALGIGADNIFT